jgi:hypothetical protein
LHFIYSQIDLIAIRTGYIDGVPMNTLVKTKDPRLPAGTKFNSLVVKEQLNVTSAIIDGVNVTSVFQQRVPLRGNSTIKSNIVFRNAVTAGKTSAFFYPHFLII